MVARTEAEALKSPIDILAATGLDLFSTFKNTREHPGRKTDNYVL
jgi:hypothetical protein